MSHQHSVQAHLGMAATDYDRVIRTLIPGYERMLATIVWWLSQIIPQHGRVIELGGGTGALAEAVLSTLPKSVWRSGTSTPRCLPWRRTGSASSRTALHCAKRHSRRN